MSLNIRWGPFEAELKSIPPNSRFGQYLPWNMVDQTYETSGFNPRLCRGSISPEEVRLVVRQLKANPYYKVDRIPLTCWAIPIVILALIVAITLLNRDRPFSTARKLAILVCLALLLVLPVLLMLAAKRSSANRDRERVGRLKRALKDLQTIHLGQRSVDLRISSLGSYLIIDTSRGVQESSQQIAAQQGAVTVFNFSQHSPSEDNLRLVPVPEDTHNTPSRF